MRTRKKPRRRRKKRSSSPASVRVFLGLGSNLGNRRSHLEAALAEIARLSPLRRVSSLYESDPVGYAHQPDFLNVVAEIAWSGRPEALLEDVKGVERRIGRTPSFANGPREIDIDILDFGGQVRRSPDPVLPHPRLASRLFALAPLAEIAPRWRHPVSGLTARQIMKTLPSTSGVRQSRSNP